MKAFDAIMAASIMAGSFDRGHKSRTSIEDIDFTPKTAPVPKGCQKFEFYHNGEKFECIASNHKNALRKFKNWKHHATNRSK
jgi:hypothetical protein